jgi:hypothetical protein
MLKSSANQVGVSLNGYPAPEKEAGANVVQERPVMP